MFWFWFLSIVFASIISIDYGSEYFKVALVKPGHPLDIVLNHESKRKTASVVTFKGDQRFYASEAQLKVTCILI